MQKQYDINGNHSVWDQFLRGREGRRGGGVIPAQEKLKNVQAMGKYFMHNPKFRKKLPQKIPLSLFQKNKMAIPKVLSQYQAAMMRQNISD